MLRIIGGMANLTAMFLPGTRFTSKDARFFCEYFDPIMDSFSAGRRLVAALGRSPLRECMTLVELGCGSGSYLSGIRRAIGGRPPRMIGVDNCAALLRKAPAWMEQVLCDITDYTAVFPRAAVLFSPCLLEAVRDATAIDQLLQKAISRAEKGIVAFGVHSGPEYLRRFPVGSARSFRAGHATVSFRTLRQTRGVLAIEWTVRKERGGQVYSREYLVRPKCYEYWERRLRSQRQIQKVDVFPDDTEGGRYRQLFVGYF